MDEGRSLTVTGSGKFLTTSHFFWGHQGMLFPPPVESRVLGGIECTGSARQYLGGTGRVLWQAGGGVSRSTGGVAVE